MPYSLVSPELFTVEQQQLVDRFKDSILAISSQNNICMGAKDIHSRHLIATDAYAQIVGLKNGQEVTDRFDRDMPCEGTAQFAADFVNEDQRLIISPDIGHSISVLNIHRYSDGLKARVFRKHILKHHESRSILGVIYYSHDVSIRKLFRVLNEYFSMFGVACSLEQADMEEKVANGILTEYEQEVCFFLLMNWNFAKIAHFMSTYRPTPHQINADSISQSTARICEKIGLPNTRLSDLRETLIYIGVHKRVPKSLFKTLLGSWQL
jgi:hypothetical protein